MTQHAKLSPSSAARRVACPGSRALEARYPQGESPHSREGEAAHWVAANYLKGCFLNLNIGAIATNGETITTEMLEGAALYAGVINGTQPTTGAPYKLCIEETIDISVIHPDCFGTPDCWFYDSDSHTVHIFDYKFGHGFVEVFENWQLIEYAAGILEKVGVNGLQDQKTKVVFYIVQPRSYHRDGAVRTWKVRACDLRPYFNILQTKENEASQEHAMCYPSPECTHCAARHACPTLQRSTLATCDITETNIPNELSPYDSANELRFLKRAAELLDARITGLTEQVSYYLRSGERLPFFKLEQGIGREVWSVNDEQIITLGEWYGFDLSKPKKAVTPKQAIKLGMPEEVLQPLVVRPTGALNLVSDNCNMTRKIFGGNK